MTLSYVSIRDLIFPVDADTTTAGPTTNGQSNAAPSIAPSRAATPMGRSKSIKSMRHTIVDDAPLSPLSRSLFSFSSFSQRTDSGFYSAKNQRNLERRRYTLVLNRRRISRWSRYLRLRLRGTVRTRSARIRERQNYSSIYG